MPVAVMHTKYGQLVGTRSHPIRLAGAGEGEGAWREIGVAHAEGLLPGTTLEERFVPTLYNLEVSNRRFLNIVLLLWRSRSRALHTHTRSQCNARSTFGST